MLKNALIIALVAYIIYLHYQQRKTNPNFLGSSSDHEDTIRELQTQLQQASQLETCNSEKLTNYQTQANRLQEQIRTLQGEGDWETKTAETITALETEVHDLTTERDEAIRSKNSAEQEYLAANNRLKNKSREADNKIKQIELLKKEKSASEIALNKRIEELKKDQKDLQEKYSKQGKLLDEEQTDNNRLAGENEKLTEKIKELQQAETKLLENPEPNLELEIAQEKIADLEEKFKLVDELMSKQKESVWKRYKEIVNGSEES